MNRFSALIIAALVTFAFGAGGCGEGGSGAERGPVGQVTVPEEAGESTGSPELVAEPLGATIDMRTGLLPATLDEETKLRWKAALGSSRYGRHSSREDAADGTLVSPW